VSICAIRGSNPSVVCNLSYIIIRVQSVFHPWLDKILFVFFVAIFLWLQPEVRGPRGTRPTLHPCSVRGSFPDTRRKKNRLALLRRADRLIGVRKQLLCASSRASPAFLVAFRL